MTNRLRKQFYIISNDEASMEENGGHFEEYIYRPLFSRLSMTLTTELTMKVTFLRQEQKYNL